MSRSTFITVSNAEFYEVLLEDSEQGETNWTISRHARPGDRMLLYICKPISAVVAVCTVATMPEQIDDPTNEWFGSFMADMQSLQMLKEPIERTALIERFPTWGYWKQPRNSVRVPEPYVEQIDSLVG